MLVPKTLTALVCRTAVLGAALFAPFLLLGGSFVHSAAYLILVVCLFVVALAIDIARWRLLRRAQKTLSDGHR